MSAKAEHVISIVSSFLSPLVYASCRCGWESEPRDESQMDAIYREVDAHVADAEGTTS